MNNINELYSLRNLLHQNPETAFNEEKTQRILLDFIEQKTAGRNNFNIIKPFSTSILVEYRGTKPEKPFLLFRADMDALSIKEPETNPVKSANNCMHACGHDIHMSVLAGLIEWASTELPEINILFVFQPGEEGAGGAKKMFEHNIFDSYKIAAAFALHVTDDYNLGEIASNSHVLFAIPREVNILFKGSSSHAAFPQKGNDAIAMAAHFLTTINHITAKRLDPMNQFLVHIGKIEGGDARNIMADKCSLFGTLRALTKETMNQGAELVEKCAKESASLFGGEAEVETLGEFLPVINSEKLYLMAKKEAEKEKIIGKESPTRLVGEDFGFFCEKYDSLMFWLGSKTEGKQPFPLHSPYYFPDYKTIDTGLLMMEKLALTLTNL